MANYILARSFNKANIQNRLYYAMDNSDLDTLKQTEKLAFGDRVYVIKAKTYHVFGNDNTWYEIKTDASAGLPDTEPADNGKVLTVVNSKWAKAELPTELPAATGSDNGKWLRVNTSGKWVVSDFANGEYDITISGTTAGGNVAITWPTGMSEAEAITTLANKDVPVAVKCTSLPNDTMGSVTCHLVSIADYMNFIFKGYYSYTSGSDTLWNEVTVIIHVAGTRTAEVYVKAFTPTDS